MNTALFARFRSYYMCILNVSRMFKKIYSNISVSYISATYLADKNTTQITRQYKSNKWYM